LFTKCVKTRLRASAIPKVFSEVPPLDLTKGEGKGFGRKERGRRWEGNGDKGGKGNEECKGRDGGLRRKKIGRAIWDEEGWHWIQCLWAAERPVTPMDAVINRFALMLPML
jgi:hypothetical protein